MNWAAECFAQGDVATIGGIVCIIQNLLRFFPPFLLLIAIGVLIFAGLRMIVGSDNPKEMEAAQKTLTFAIIGVIGIGLSWIILVLIQSFTGAPVTEINLPQ